jgi:tRNA-dihydrouridine synthase 1
MASPPDTDESPEQRKQRKALKTLKKEAKKEKKRSRSKEHFHDDANDGHVKRQKMLPCDEQPQTKNLPDLRYILAPMVGASELAFRLLCRKYGATLAYTPMMDAARFANDESYRRSELGLVTSNDATSSIDAHLDRPLVCHFSANTPEDFSKAAMAAAPYCDAIDLNLGCPQRTAHVGHFGSYLLGPEDRPLVCAMIAAAAHAVPNTPICVKIRLLDVLEDTIQLVQQLHDAGASWIAIHARYRATWDRKGPGARDGPALLEQIAAIRERLPHVTLIANGNIQSFEDCQKNLKFTKANGVMSAEGILDNPALFLPRYGKDVDQMIEIPNFCASTAESSSSSTAPCADSKTKRKLEKKLRNIMLLEAKRTRGESLTEEEEQKLGTKKKAETQLHKVDHGVSPPLARSTKISLADLMACASQKVNLANEYLALVRLYPIAIRTVVFHIRRMLRDELTKYQLMDDCVAAPTLEDVQQIVDKVQSYQRDPSSFLYDEEKAIREKEALAKKKHEEGKRKRFEDRMIRKAKREGKTDLDFYLRVGALVPSKAVVAKLKTLSRDDQLAEWKKNHSQHCMAYHLSTCQRDRGCAFLHVDSELGTNSFVESDEVAG